MGMFKKRDKRREQLIQCLNSDVGRILLKHLYEDNVEIEAFNENATTMAYNLGKKELVQGLINESKVTREDLDRIQVISYEDNQYD